tara:strand:+ start:12939 stop:13250 length:312 start_codon:yes stop_codon:yes gene_type:complete
MKKLQSELQAIVLTKPSLRPVFNHSTCKSDLHLSYNAEMQYVRKPPETRLILCSGIDDIQEGEHVMVTYHLGMRAYQHSRHISVSNSSNCTGGFYYTNGKSAE